MSWHTNFIAIKNFDESTEKLIKRLLVSINTDSCQKISFDDAGKSNVQGVAAGKIADWNILFSPQLFLMPTWLLTDGFQSEIFKQLKEFQSDLISMSQKYDILTCILEGVSGTYGYSFYSGGEIIREALFQEGELIGEFGENLPGEEEKYGEDKIFSICKKMGLFFDFDSNLNTEFVTYPWREQD